MKLESFFFGIACSFFLLSGYVVYDGAKNYRPAPVRQPTNGYPIIPDCPKELWDRIRGECGD